MQLCAKCNSWANPDLRTKTIISFVLFLLKNLENKDKDTHIFCLRSLKEQIELICEKLKSENFNVEFLDETGKTMEKKEVLKYYEGWLSDINRRINDIVGQKNWFYLISWFTNTYFAGSEIVQKKILDLVLRTMAYEHVEKLLHDPSIAFQDNRIIKRYEKEIEKKNWFPTTFPVKIINPWISV